MLTLYDYWESGNAYKVRLLLHQLEIPYRRVECDILVGETRTPEFLRRNPNGRVPVLVLEDGRTLCESNAIQFYLAEGTSLLPEDRLERARALQWMFFEQYSHEPYIAVARFWHFAGLAEAKRDQLPEKWERGRQALDVMERHLAERDFFAGGRYTIADIALFAYTHVAPEGGFDLAPYPRIRSWIARIQAQPRHIPLARSHPEGSASRPVAAAQVHAKTSPTRP